MKKQNKTPALLIALFLVFLVAHLVPVLSGETKLWGLDQWRYLPRSVVFTLLAFGLLVPLQGVRSALAGLAGRLRPPRPLSRTKSGRVTGVLLAGVLAAALFWLFRNATHLLGDGYVWAEHMQRDVVFNEPVTTWLYRGLFMLLNGVLSITVPPDTTAAAISVVAGLVFLFFAAGTARLLGRTAEESALVLLALLSTGTMLLFFGYIESYPPLVAGVMAFIYFGARYASRGTAPAVPSVAAFAVAVLLHPSAIALLPALAILLWQRRYGVMNGKRYYACLGVLTAVGLAGLWTLQHLQAAGGFFHETFVPLFPGPPRNRIAYPLFSPKTLFDAANQLVLVCPTAVFIFAGLRWRRGPGAAGAEKTYRQHERVAVFLRTAAIFCILEFLVFNKNIGVSRDWDLFAAMAIPLAVLAALVLITRYPRAHKAAAVLVAAIIVVHTVPWIVLNASTERSEERFLDLVENGFWSDYARGYGYSSLGFYYRRLGDAKRSTVYIRAASEADSGNVRYLYNLATTYAGQGRSGDAVGIYRQVIERDPDFMDARNNLSVLLWKMGRLEEAEREFSAIMQRDPTCTRSFFEPLLHIYTALGRTDEAAAMYARTRAAGEDMAPRILEIGTGLIREGKIGEALAMFEVLYRGGSRDVAVMNNIGAMLGRLGRVGEALRIFEEAAAAHPQNPDIRLNLARTYFVLGEYETARRHLESARRLGANIPEAFEKNLRKALQGASP